MALAAGVSLFASPATANAEDSTGDEYEHTDDETVTIDVLIR